MRQPPTTADVKPSPATPCRRCERPAGRLLWLLLSLVLAACGGEPGAADGTIEPDGLERIVLHADWLAEAEHGGFFLARQRGYYRQQGLEVDIQGSATPINAYRKVAAGDAHFALGTSDNLIVAMSRGLPVVGVLPYFQRDPQGVMFRRDSGIRTLQDLDGRRVKISAGLHYVEFLQRTLGIRLQLVPMDGSTAQFVAEPDLVQQCFLTSEPWIVAQAGVEVDVLPFWDMALDPYRLVLTSQDMVRTRPDLVRRFVEASLQGWTEYMAGDTAGVFAEIVRLNPAMSLPFLEWAYTRMQSFRIVQGREDAGEIFGQVSLPRLQAQIGQLAALDLLDRPVDAGTVMVLDGYPQSLVVNTGVP